MNANELIEAYVAEVALQLPRKQRNDVAFELRALLHEDLQARAEEAGRSADAVMATELLRAFGRPADVAARYLPTLTVIDPADGRSFLRAAAIGLAIIWGLGLLRLATQPLGSGTDFLLALGQWWGGSVLPSLWWPGMLAVGFGTAAWVRRRWPHTAEWRPRDADRIHGGRAALAMGILGIVSGIYVLIQPSWLLDVVWGGRAAPAAYEALTYTDAFLQRQAPWLLALLVLNVPIFITVLVNGRWSKRIRQLQAGQSLVLCAVMVWTALDGPVFMTSASDRTFKGATLLIVSITLIGMGVKWYRSVRPSPNREMHA